MMKIIKNLSKRCRSVLCLGGDLPCDFIKPIGLPIVAADGAANVLIQSGLEPYIILGDLDSVDEALLRGRPHLRIESQDSTDFEKALDYIEKESLAPTIVMGMFGGYADHVLGNISIFSRTQFFGISGDVIFTTLNGERCFEVPLNTKISIFGIPRCTITSSGLKWELHDDALSIGGMNSHSNRAAEENVLLRVSSGRAIIFLSSF
jgi:thiamine pyrophosphokinase